MNKIAVYYGEEGKYQVCRKLSVYADVCICIDENWKEILRFPTVELSHVEAC